MNCQAFRKAWLDDTDSDSHSHIETCDECIAWIETQMTTEEEVQFLKEVPLPQANLEDRIMQAIYQTAGKGVPPHAATASSEQQTSTVISKPNKRWTKGFPSYAWVSAAAVLLAVGFVSYQQLAPSSNQMAAIQETGAQDNQIKQNIVAFDEGESKSATQASAPAIASQPAAADSTTMKKAESNPESAATQSQVAPTAPAKDTPPASPPQSNNAIAMVKPEEKVATSEARTVNKDGQNSVASRGLQGNSVDQATKAKSEVPAESANTGNHISAKEANGAAAENPMTFGIASQGEQDTEDGATTEKALVGPALPALAKQPITLSSFTDLNTAVQASDMPVPALSQAPNGFSMSTVSVQYESETSQKVTRLTSDYKRNNDWIRIDVVRNTEGKRSLSIPGTFSATQLFAVNGEQAIAVSFDQTDSKASTAQHAAHFNAKSDNQSLYVVMTAHGVTLNELMDAAKHISWNP
ncbi:MULTISPECIES: hypothetical protein [Bacillales]|uniref:hypothetical protein n=1 Tax=Bacillales TaxID=1385 RepID=UPI000347EAD4|nr:MULTISPECIES: hypothetical protein [Bacillales]KMZ40002.1 hypothetical protein AC624_02385 [Bacillus sp. FJAT-27238]